MLGAALTWVHLAGAGACASGDELAREVEARVGRQVFVSSRDADVVVEGVIGRRGDDWRAIIVARDKQRREIGRRAIVVSEAGATCAAMTMPVVEAIVDLVPAIVIVVATEEAKRRNAAAEAKARRRARVAATPVRLESGLSVYGSMGLLPAADGGAVGAGLDALVEPRGARGWVGAHVFASWWLPREADGAQELRLALAGAGACVSVVRARGATVRACGHAELGAMHGRASDLRAPVRPSSSALVALDAGLRASVPLGGGIAVRAGAALLVPLVRESFVVGDEEIFRVAPVGGLADVGVGVVLR